MQIEGRNAVAEALKSGRTFDKVMIQKAAVGGSANELITKLKDSRIRLQFVDKTVLDKVSEEGRHQGFIAYVSDYKYCSVEDILKGDNRKLIVILDSVNDPHNLGSVIRTCECMGASVIIGKNRSASVNETVERISEGAVSHVKIARVTNINDTIKLLQKNNIWVMALEAGGTDIAKSNLKGDLALVVGGEDNGVSRLTKEISDGVISIPMTGKINSLNLGVAAGIAMYEVARQNKA